MMMHNNNNIYIYIYILYIYIDIYVNIRIRMMMMSMVLRGPGSKPRAPSTRRSEAFRGYTSRSAPAVLCGSACGVQAMPQKSGHPWLLENRSNSYIHSSLNPSRKIVCANILKHRKAKTGHPQTIVQIYYILYIMPKQPYERISHNPDCKPRTQSLMSPIPERKYSRLII